MLKSTLAEKNCRWHPIFRGDNDNGIGPSEPMQENFRQAPYASLVRESIQNSLDVVRKDSDKPVEMRFSIGFIDSKNFPNFFEISNHIQGCIDNFPNNDKAKRIYPPMLKYINKVNSPGGKLYFIRVSDYNTQGMPYENLEDNDSPFYAFVRSAGVSSKSDESAGGSFGFGKAAYFYMSPLRTILVSTKTDDDRYFFEGVCSLCSHKIDGRTVSNIVYYDNNEGNPTTQFDRIPGRFQRKDKDGKEEESGTDIFIMGVDFENVGTEQEIYEEMLLATLENFWLAILDNKLIVRIGKGDQEKVVDSTNIAALMEEYFEENDVNKRMRRGSIGRYNPRPYFTAVNLSGSTDKFIYRKVDLNEIERLREIQTLSSWGCIHYYFAKNKQATNRIVYMRGLKMTVSISTARNGEGYYGVIVCPDGECNTWLRKMENPAHNIWDYKRLENKWDKKIAKALLEVIDEEKNKIIREIFNLDELETVKIKGLEQYLYISSEADDEADDDGSVSSVKGEPIGKFFDEGFSPTTNTADIRKMPLPEGSALLGSVLVMQPGATSPNEDGSVLTGRGNTHIKKPHTNNHISAAKPRQRNQVENNDTDSHSLEPIMVKYRTFAQIKNGIIVHKLILTNDKHPIERGQIDLLIGGESSDSKISIASSTKGDVLQNSIVNLPLPIGKTSLEICFADNLKHSIKLAAYEVK